MKKYSGELQLVGEGRKEMQYGVSGYSVLEIGKDILKNVHATELVSTYLQTGEELELYIGPLFFSKYIYALRRSDGRLIKMGVGLFILSLVIKMVFALVLFGFGFALGGIGPLILGGLGVYLLLRSVKALYAFIPLK